jgi:RecA/RadA recombinase
MAASPSFAQATLNPEIQLSAGIFYGRELTPKRRLLGTGLRPLDAILAGGIVRGRISEITGPPSSGKTSLATSLIAAATRRGEASAWIDSTGSFDPASMAAAGVELARVLWVHPRSLYRPSASQLDLESGILSPAGETIAAVDALHEISTDALSSSYSVISAGRRADGRKTLLKAAELVVETGNFGLVVVDFGFARYPIPQNAALRLARKAERSGAAVLVLAARRMCGTFAVLSLALNQAHLCFSRPTPYSPALFDGISVSARVARNKLGTSGHSALWQARLDSPVRSSVSEARRIETDAA